MNKHIQALRPLLLLAALLIGVSGCGTNADSRQVGAKPGGNPDRVRIEIDAVGPTPTTDVVTLLISTQVQQLYTTIFALPQMPQGLSCTLEAGPHYTLTFQQGTKTLATIKARREGCRPVSIAGETTERRGSEDFWSQLDQAIYKATPVARPARLSIQHTLQVGQPPSTAQITSPEQAQRLYDALLALPQDVRKTNCSPELWPEYQLVFHTADQAIPSLISKRCNTVSLGGMNRSRGGTYLMNTRFQQVFAQTLAEAKFAPASPDQLALTIQRGDGTVQHGLVADAALTQRLYTKIFALPVGKPEQGCPAEADKVAGTGKWYTLSFTQWDLPVLGIGAYEGNCRLISFSVDGQVLLGDQEFWDLIHRTGSQ